MCMAQKKMGESTVTPIPTQPIETTTPTTQSGADRKRTTPRTSGTSLFQLDLIPSNVGVSSGSSQSGASVR